MTATADGGIFLSYRRDDTRHVAGRLFDHLGERFGDDNVFIDVTSVEAGVDFGQALEQAVGRCDVLIALIGTTWLDSRDEQGRRRLDDPDDWVAREIGTALTRDIRVIPVVVDGAAVPRREELPPRLGALARRSAFRLDHETFRSDVRTLLDVLGRALPTADRTGEGPGTGPGPPPARRSASGSGDRQDRPPLPVFTVDDHLELPTRVDFGELVTDPGTEAIGATWSAEQEGLPVPLGRTARGVCVVDLVRDGPHTLVVGTSGAGKSELLGTVVLGAALARPPDQLGFLFLDLKGGRATRDLARLPHTVGSITDMDRRDLRRAVDAVAADLARNVGTITASGAASIDEYLRRRRSDPRLPAVPRLVVVVEELAEVSAQHPDLVEALVELATRGRSLGLHLLLATQRAGATLSPALRAGCNLRICLRTRDAADSLDVVGIPDAGHFSDRTPGRAVVDRAGDRELVQAAMVGLPGLPHSAALPRHVDRVLAAAAATSRTAERGVVPALPDVVTLDRFDPPRLAILLGLQDRPAARGRAALTVPLGTGHLAIIGSSRSGRTGALRLIAASLASAAGVDDLHLHAITVSGELRALTALPHVGTVVAQDDRVHTRQFLTALTDEVSARRRRMADRGAADVRELGPGRPPQIVLLVDDWRQVLVDTESRVQRLLLTILEDGPAAGVTVCLTSDERLFSTPLIGRFRYRLFLRLDDAETGARAGFPRHALLPGLPPGRGIWSADGTEVQVPLLDPDPRGVAQTSALRLLGARLSHGAGAAAPAHPPLRAESLPGRISRRVAEALGPPRDPVDPASVLIGVGHSPLRAVRVDPREGALLVAGPRRSGRSTAAETIAVGAAACGMRVVLVSTNPAPAAVAAGVVVLAPPRLEGVRETAPRMLVVDDADRIEDHSALLDLGTDPDVAVCVTGDIDAFGFGRRGLIRNARRSPGTVILLSPPHHLAAELLDVTLERGDGFSGPPGRAVFKVRGSQLLGQVAVPD